MRPDSSIRGTFFNLPRSQNIYMACTVSILVTVVLLGVAHHIVDGHGVPFYFARPQTAADALLPGTGNDRIFPDTTPATCKNCALKNKFFLCLYIYSAVTDATTTASTRRTTIKNQHKPPSVPTIPTITAEIHYKPLFLTTTSATTTVAITNPTPVPSTTEY